MSPDEDSDVTFGDPGDFAIQAGVEPGLKRPSPIWGHMCVWCKGICLGDIDNRHCGLYSAFCGFEWLAEHLDELWDEQLVGRDDLGIWNFFDERLYGWRNGVDVIDERPREYIEADAVRYDKFNFLTNWDELFDRHKAFIFRPPNTRAVRILVQTMQAPMIAISVSAVGVLTASRGFVRWFREQEQRLSSET